MVMGVGMQWHVWVSYNCKLKSHTDTEGGCCACQYHASARGVIHARQDGGKHPLKRVLCVHAYIALVMNTLYGARLITWYSYMYARL